MYCFRASVLACVLLAATSARAAFFVEPYAGYATGSTDAHIKAQTGLPNGSSASSKETEISVGSRFGFVGSSGIWLAADPQLGLAGMTKGDLDGHSNAYTRTQIFADLGFDYGILRVYAGFGVLNELKAESKFSGGTAWKAGLGLSMTSHLSLFAEYHSNSYKDVVNDEGTNPVSNYFDKFDGNLIVVGLSIPIGTQDR